MGSGSSGHEIVYHYCYHKQTNPPQILKDITITDKNVVRNYVHRIQPENQNLNQSSTNYNKIKKS